MERTLPRIILTTPTRLRPILVYVFLSSLAIAAVAALYHGGGSSDVGPADTVAEVEPLPVVADPTPQIELRRAVLGRGGTLTAAFEAVGLPAETREPVLQALRPHVDLRRLSPETGLVARFSENGMPLDLSVRDSADSLVRVTFEEASIAAGRIVLPTHSETRVVSAVLESSVAQALATDSFGTRLTPEFADIFQWDVDLLVDPRPGDEVRVLYEVIRLGDVPDALPAFGRAATEKDAIVGLGRIVAAAYHGRMAAATAFWIDEGDGKGSYYDSEGKPLRKSFLKSPLNYRRISSRFSNARRNPVTRKVVPHHGVDYAAASGTPVVASADGRVVSAGWDGPLGRAVRIRHGSEYVTIYGHLRGFAKGIRAGVAVRQNEVIGYVGSTGRSTGPHLHYTVLHRGRAIDPLRMENPPVQPLDPLHRPQLELAVQRWHPAIALDREDVVEWALDDHGGETERGRRPLPGV